MQVVVHVPISILIQRGITIIQLMLLSKTCSFNCLIVNYHVFKDPYHTAASIEQLFVFKILTILLFFDCNCLSLACFWPEFYQIMMFSKLPLSVTCYAACAHTRCLNIWIHWKVHGMCMNACFGLWCFTYAVLVKSLTQ